MAQSRSYDTRNRYNQESRRLINCKVITSDRLVWNHTEVISALTHAAVIDQCIVLDLVSEGPDFCELDIADFIRSLPDLFGYDLSKITVKSCNIKQPAMEQIFFDKSFPVHFISSTQKNCKNKNIVKNCNYTFGMFIGRSNQHRLDISSYLHNNYSDKSIQTFHYNPTDDFHKNNLGLESLINANVTDIEKVAQFISLCPIRRNETVTYPILTNQHCNHYQEYNNFFVEIVCETFYSGKTFFPTEKTWRPIALETPFILQGPSCYLKELKMLGFETFSDWWDEGYTEDPSDHQVVEIKRIIDFLANLNTKDIQQMYTEMKPVIDHNKNLFFSLTKQDFQ